MSDLIVKINGGLGNQLFLYAAGYSLAKRLNVPLKLDLSFFEIKESEEITVRNYLLSKFNIPQPEIAVQQEIFNEIGQYEKFKSYLKSFAPVMTAWRLLKKNPVSSKLIKIVKGDPKPVDQDSHIYIQYSYLPVDDYFFQMKDITYIYGSFMSEHYFKDYADDIRSFFSLKEPLSKLGESNLNEIRKHKNAISFHVRRGDYVSQSEVQALNGSTSLDYYKRAVALMQKMYGDDIHFFAFSDDPEYIRQTFEFLPNKTVITGDVEYPHEDIYLMSQCKHHIIANSTFSWWGAWLNPNKDKTVIAPRWWFSRETMKTHNTMDVCPEGWLMI